MSGSATLSSSVSMFIEDSRVAAVANADVNPRNPSSFYSVSSFRHSPNITVHTQIPASSIPSATKSSINQNVQLGHFQAQQQQEYATLNNGNEHSSDYGYNNNCVPMYYATVPSPTTSTTKRSKRKPREIIHKIIRESSREDEDVVDGCEPRGDGSGCSSRKSSCSGPNSVLAGNNNNQMYSSHSWTSAPATSPSTIRSTTTLSLEPFISMINVKENIPNRRDDRTYTSVNLTLRSPTSAVNMLPGSTSTNVNVNSVVDVESSGGGGIIRIPELGNNSVTYSSYSNSRDGFESQLQIQIGPNGGTISASRHRRNHAHPSAQQMTAELISAQLERKDKLRTALICETEKLMKLRGDIQHLRKRIQPFHDQVDRLRPLREENQKLRCECDVMTKAVDLYENGTVPLGETNEEFYRGINTGQDLHSFFGYMNFNNERHDTRETQSLTPMRIRTTPPPRPPPPRVLNLPIRPPPQPETWSCSMCTFLNHPDLAVCESCGMVRFKTSSVPRSPVPGYSGNLGSPSSSTSVRR